MSGQWLHRQVKTEGLVQELQREERDQRWAGMGTQLRVESEGRECPEIRGLGVSGWSRITCSSPGCLFAAIILYGSSKSLKIEDGKHHQTRVLVSKVRF